MKLDKEKDDNIEKQEKIETTEKGEEEADFERDDDQAELENVEDDDRTNPKQSLQSNASQATNFKNGSKKSVKKSKGKKKKSKKEKKKAEEPPPKNTNILMDVLFSFIGVSSSQDNSEVLKQQYKLGLFEEQYLHSRQSAGTTQRRPGATDAILAFTDSMSSRSSQRDLPVESSSEAHDLPELLPTSCGYFKNILLKILVK